MGELLESPRPEVSSDEAARAVALAYGVEGVPVPLPGERDRNFRLDTADGPLCLKVANRLDDLEVVEMQALALEHVARVDAGLPVPRVVRTRAGSPVGSATVDGAEHALLVTSFLPGEPPPIDGAKAELRISLGRLAARLDRALSSFFHPRAGRQLLWDVSRLAQLRPHTSHVRPGRRDLVARWLDEFDRELAPALRSLRAQPIHGDLHQGNLLVDTAAPERITGIVDFGDMTHAALVLDPAVSSAYQCFRQHDVEAAVHDLVRAYHEESPLAAAELRLLPGLIACRLVQSVVVAAWRATIDPENTEYIRADEDDAWETLVRLSETDLERMADGLIEIAGDSGPPPAEVVDLETSIARRRDRLGPALSLSYDAPVRPVRGDGVWLVEADGTRYLDAYNNVPHVGHSRPEVVEAVSRQMRLLTTNTRYLVDSVTDYADRLAALLPGGLDVVMFVNSGSEANDLAYQIAAVVTGNRGVLLTEHAYHGCTMVTTAMSPEEFGLDRLEPWAATIPAPHPRGGEGRAGAVVRHVTDAVTALGASGHAPAMLIADSIFSSDGIFLPPRGFLQSAYRAVRAAGGLCVADEVQAGFGRVGLPFWGFGADDVVPDIVTLGKPMGNGHPMGAVVTTREIVEEFAHRWHFFSTFAGSPVAAAAGSAVLDVLERDRLAEHAEVAGAELRSGLEAVAARFPAVGHVRGAGLFVGVEIVAADGAPAPYVAAAVVEGLRRRRVLIGRTGPDGNVLKIRPPLVFDADHAEVLLAALDDVLSAL